MHWRPRSVTARRCSRGEQAVEEVRRAFAQLHAPPEVLEALERLRPLAARQALTDHEVQAIRTLVQDIQGMLSE